jgi:hypothetical protein
MCCSSARGSNTTCYRHGQARGKQTTLSNWTVKHLASAPWSVVVFGASSPFLLPADNIATVRELPRPVCNSRQAKCDAVAGERAPNVYAQHPPTVRRPTNRVPAIEVLTTGMWSASSASNTLRAPACGRRQISLMLAGSNLAPRSILAGCCTECCLSIAGYRMQGMVRSWQMSIDLAKSLHGLPVEVL